MVICGAALGLVKGPRYGRAEYIQLLKLVYDILVRARKDGARVVGLASSVLFDTQNPDNPINRRISIIVMTKGAEAAALSTIPTVCPAAALFSAAAAASR